MKKLFDVIILVCTLFILVFCLPFTAFGEIYGSGKSVINIVDFGCVMDDNTTAVTNDECLERVISVMPTTGATIFIPAGTLYLSSDVVVLNKAFSIIGAGRGASAIQWVSSSSSVGFVVTQNSLGYVTHFEALELETAVIGDNGTAITIDYSPCITDWDGGQTGNALLSEVTELVLITDIHVRPATDGAQANTWNGGIRLITTNGVKITRYSFRGGGALTGWPTLASGFVFPSEYGIKVEGIPYSTILIGSSSIDNGIATGTQTTATLQDTSQSWITDEYKGKLIKLTGGTGAGQIRRIKSNTSNTLTIGGSLYWETTPVSASTTYTIMDGHIDITTGTLDSATSSTVTDAQLSSDGWATNGLKGRTICITGGLGEGQCRRIASSTTNILTMEKDWYITPDTTSTYNIRDPNAMAPDTYGIKITSAVIENVEHGVWLDRVNTEGYIATMADIVHANYGHYFDFVEPNGSNWIVDSHHNCFQGVYANNATNLFISRMDMYLHNNAPDNNTTIYLTDGSYDSQGIYESGNKIIGNLIHNLNKYNKAQTAIHLSASSGGTTIENNSIIVQNLGQVAGNGIIIDSTVNHAVIGENTWPVETTLNNTSTFITDNSADTVYKISTNLFSSSADNEIIAYDLSSMKWINQTATEAGLYGVGGTDVAITDGGTGASSLDNLITLGAHTTGNYVSSATTSQGLTMTGTEGASLGLSTCLDGQILKNSGGTSWSCASDATTGTPANDSITPNMLLSAGQTDEYCLTYEVTGNTWEWQSCAGGGASQLSDLSDVNTSTPTSGNFLRADGVDWESAEIQISDLPTNFLNGYTETVHTTLVNTAGFSLGLATATQDGLLHLYQASAGTVDANSSFNALVIESSGNTGMSFLSPATMGIAFGSVTNGNANGQIKYKADKTMELINSGATCKTDFWLNSVNTLRLTPSTAILGAGIDFIFGNGETIDNDTDGIIAITGNATVSGTIDVTGTIKENGYDINVHRLCSDSSPSATETGCYFEATAGYTLPECTAIGINFYLWNTGATPQNVSRTGTTDIFKGGGVASSTAVSQAAYTGNHFTCNGSNVWLWY